MMTRVLSLCCLLALAAPAAAPAAALAQAPEKASFIIRRGADTVATEEVSRTPTEITGELTVRARKNTERYHAVIAPDGTVPLVEVTVQEQAPSAREKARVAQRTRIIFRGDSASVDDISGRGLETRILATEHGALPYLNLSFGLLEQAVRRATAAGKPEFEVPFFNLGGSAGQYGGQTARGKVTRIGADSVSLAIGNVEFRMQVDKAGRLLGGGIPKQQLIFVRTAAGS
jgi:hypothetical protein